MKMTMIALAATLSMGAAIPAFADQGPRASNGFYYDRAGQTADATPYQAGLGQPQTTVDPMQSDRGTPVRNGYYYDRAGQTA
jgi:hypothetical protein